MRKTTVGETCLIKKNFGSYSVFMNVYDGFIYLF